MSQYVKILNRIADCVESRAHILRRDPALPDLVTQLSLRAKAMSLATVRLEIAAVRSMFRDVTCQHGEVAWPDGVIERDWMFSPGQENFDKARSLALEGYRAIIGKGDLLLPYEIELARHNGFALTDDEIIERLSGRKRLETRQNQKRQRHLSWRDMMALEIELSSHDPVDSLNSLLPDAEGRARLEGLLRIFINTMWFTGMRPKELWNCVLMVPRVDLPFDDAMARLVAKDPTRAIHENLMMKVEEAAAMTGDKLGDAARNAMLKSRAPCVLMIKSAKTTNMNPALKADFRLQVLVDIPPLLLNMVALATQCRKLRLSDERKDAVRASMTRILKKVAAKDPRLAELTINLYAFRHSFATRVKKNYFPHEAAALTGHSSVKTLSLYGEHGARRKSGGTVRLENWLPEPDPVHADFISRVWASEPGAGPAPEENATNRSR